MQHTTIGKKQHYVKLFQKLECDEGNTENAVDIGCGNGRFTFIISEKFKYVYGYDLSQKLISLAHQTASENNIKNVEFSQQDLNKKFPSGIYDLVSCMGVTSAIIDEKMYIELISNLLSVTKLGGYLITKDTLSIEDNVNFNSGEYAAIYRNQKHYENCFQEAGVKCVLMINLNDDPKRKLVNNIYLWRH
jgi:ubiquinone/menaquinone biosynthesis C-methylase UbiE